MINGGLKNYAVIKRILRGVLGLLCILLSYTSYAQVAYRDVVMDVGINHTYGEGVAGGGVSFYDFDGDGWDDISLTSELGEESVFYKNNHGIFEQVANGFISNLTQTKHILWVDYDNDNDQDLFITSFSDNRLYNNNGKMEFTDVTAAVGLSTDSVITYGAVWGDYDKDGWLDLYVTNRSLNGAPATNNLYRSNGDGTFSETTTEAGVADEGKIPFCAAFLDYNNDGWPDIYIAQDRKSGNTLLKNNGDGTFSDVSIESNSDLIMDAMCVAVGDYDNNGSLDIYVSNIADGNKLLKNNGNGIFDEVADLVGVSFNSIAWGSNFLDYNNDTNLDLYVSGMLAGSDNISSALYKNSGAGEFTQPGDVGMSGDTVMSFSNAIGDYNNDGYPDIMVNNHAPYSSMLWKSNANSTNNWLKINLEGKESNKSAIGSRIELYLEGEMYLRYTHCGIGFLGQNSGVEIFGLGVKEVVDSIKVLWPSGKIDVIKNIAANQQLEIIEGSSLFPPSISTNKPNFICGGDSITLSAGYYDAYLWSNGETTRTINVKSEGIYSVSVSNQTGSATSPSIEIVVNPLLELNIVNQNDMELKAIVTGGTPPYSYDWNDENMQTAPVANDLTPGTYSVVVSDNVGCIATATADIAIINGVLEKKEKAQIQLFPNPALNEIKFKLLGNNTRNVRITIFDITGRKVTDEKLKKSKNSFLYNVSNWPPGIYFLKVFSEGNTFSQKVFINR